MTGPTIVAEGATRFRLAGELECPKCGANVELWQSGDDGEEDGWDQVATGECEPCGVWFADWWEGTVMFHDDNHDRPTWRPASDPT